MAACCLLCCFLITGEVIFIVTIGALDPQAQLEAAHIAFDFLDSAKFVRTQNLKILWSLRWKRHQRVNSSYGGQSDYKAN